MCPVRDYGNSNAAGPAKGDSIRHRKPVLPINNNLALRSSRSLRSTRGIAPHQRGMSMLELMMAMTLLAIGMSGAMILLTTSIASNSRNKLDTTATSLSEMVLERIAATDINSTTPFTIYDCAGNALSVNPSGLPGGKGAAILTSGAFIGNIDFSTAPSPSTGYSVNYVTCSIAGSKVAYNIRWNIDTQPSTASPVTKRITVATRQVGIGNNLQLLSFAPPVTLKTVVGKKY